jgi:hypothetical protein
MGGANWREKPLWSRKNNASETYPLTMFAVRTNHEHVPIKNGPDSSGPFRFELDLVEPADYFFFFGAAFFFAGAFFFVAFFID